jgi:hypothetical protein
MRNLLAGWLKMMFAHGHAFLRAWSRVYATRTAIEACTVAKVISYNRAVDIGVMYNRSVYVKYCRIITKRVTNPDTAPKT